MFTTTNQSSFLALAQTKKTLRAETFLSAMDTILPYQRFLEVILPSYSSSELGRNKINPLLMLKIHFLQRWYDLSDPMMEEAIYDRMSFQKFLGIDLLSHPVPDESAILRFRHFLEEHRLSERFFAAALSLMEEQGFILHKGAIVDATIIKAPSSTKNKEKKRDEQMSGTKKGANYSFGMKAHIGVDQGSGIVHHVTTTTASTHDSVETDRLLTGKERSVFGDKAFASDERKKELRKRGVCYGILDKGKKNRPLSSSQRKRNKKLSSVRAYVEHPFLTVKRRWNFHTVRYKGLFKNAMRLHTAFALYNLYHLRRVLLSPA